MHQDRLDYRTWQVHAMDHYFDACRVLFVFFLLPYITLSGISTTIGCHLLESRIDILYAAILLLFVQV